MTSWRRRDQSGLGDEPVEQVGPVDATHHPAAELIALYHERWQAETTYFSIKATMLDGRVLRSRSLSGLDQEVYALVTTNQALIRAAADTACTRPAWTWIASASPTSPAPSAGPSSRPCHPARHRYRVKGSHL